MSGKTILRVIVPTTGNWIEMKTLVVCYSKMKGFGGGVFAARATVNALASVCDEVTVLFPADQPDERDPELMPKVRQIGVTDSIPRFRKLLRCLFRGTLHRMEKVFGALTEKESFDTIVFHNSKTSRRLIPIAKKRGAKVITVHDNYEYEYTKDNFPWYDLLWMLPITMRGEREAVRGSDLNLVLSVQDRDLLRSHYDPDCKSRFEVLGVFEYKDRPLPELGKPTEIDTFVITGNLGARQTLDSLLPWLDECWPILHRRCPEARLLVAGKNPGQALKKRLEAIGADLVDTPQDMGSVLSRGKYYVCPTCKGGGVKLRVMDGLRYGLPVLVHEVSARGYEPFMSSSLFVYHDPVSFKDALERMLDTEVDRSLILEIYSSHLSWHSGVSRMKRYLSLV